MVVHRELIEQAGSLDPWHCIPVPALHPTVTTPPQARDYSTLPTTLNTPGQTMVLKMCDIVYIMIGCIILIILEYWLREARKKRT